MGTKVTLLDDSEDLRVMVGRILKTKLGVECMGVSSVHDLIEHFEEVLSSDLVILDLNLGAGDSGLDAYKWLHEHGFKGKIFFLTGYDPSNTLVNTAQEEGVQVYQKPLETQKLISIVSSALNIH